ncbi:MAG: PAS domain S-box protein [Thermoguttaceae bacterium]
MRNEDKTREQRIAENEELQRRVAGLEGVEAETKQAERELAKSRAVLRATIDSLPFSFFAIGLDGRYMLQNAVSKAQHQADTVGKLPEEVCPNEDDLAVWLENNRRAFAGEKVEGEVTLSLGGEKRFYYNIIAPIREGEKLHGILGVNIDITERKLAEEALQKTHNKLEQRVEERTAELAKANENLRQSHDELRTIYDGMPDGLLAADIETKKFVRCNAAMRRMLGYSGDEILARSIMDIQPADEVPSVLATFHALVEGRQRIGQDIPVLRKDGSVFHADITHSEISLNGRPCTVGFFRDITERKTAEDVLRASEERFRVTFEEAPMGMAICVCDGVITKANRALCRMSGYSQEELVGRHVRDFAHPEDRETSGPFVKRLLAGEIPSFTLEKRYLRKDGQPFWAQATTAAAHGPDGKIAFALGVVEDITDRKRVEEALRRSERRFRNYFEQGLIGMAVTSVDKRWLEVNDRLCDILGYSREELLQKTWTELTFPDDIEPNLRLFNPLLAGEIEHFTLNKRYLKRGGSIVHTTIHTRAFHKEDRTIDHIVTLVEDITARTQAEEALERERQSLWRMLQASDHERQIISYEIHDGLAQYLAAAGMQFQAYDSLRENLPNEAMKAYETAVELVRQAHAESRRLISEVRPPVIDEIGLETAISHLVHEQRKRGGPKIKFDSDVQFGKLPPILENAIYRIAQEALTNACKHSKSKQVTVTMVQEGQDIRLEVRDWGIGFDTESIEEGHFGLEGIRQRARLLGGRLIIESTPDSGTLVQVVIPILEKQTES